jgi:hypothetical protein
MDHVATLHMVTKSVPLRNWASGGPTLSPRRGANANRAGHPHHKPQDNTYGERGAAGRP